MHFAVRITGVRQIILPNQDSTLYSSIVSKFLIHDLSNLFTNGKTLSCVFMFTFCCPFLITCTWIDTKIRECCLYIYICWFV